MKLRTKWIIAGLASSLLAAASAPSFATAVWTSGTGGVCNSDSSLYNSCATPFTGSGGTTLTVTALSDSAAGGVLSSAYIGYYNTNHWGVTTKAGTNAAGNNPAGTSCDNAAGAQEVQCSPQHALDNEGNQEWLLYSFGADVTLSAVTLGWTSNDSDLTVLAYEGAGAPNWTGTTDSGATGLLAKGWVVVGNYSNVGTGSATISTAVSSSYWLIGAYNYLGGNNLNDTNYDYVKVLSVAGNTSFTPPGQVPEPSSLLLAAIALFGLTALQRRRAV